VLDVYGREDTTAQFFYITEDTGVYGREATTAI
jgi:hypothetical protein